MNRFARILFPPKPEVLSNMCKQGFDDALRFLQRHNLISCTRCLAVQSTFQLQDMLDDTTYEYDPECEECKTHRQVRTNISYQMISLLLLATIMSAVTYVMCDKYLGCNYIFSIRQYRCYISVSIYIPYS